MTSRYFPPQTPDNHYVEIVETVTGKVEKRMGPLSASKAERVEHGALLRIDLERFFVRTGTDAALKEEAKAREAPEPTLVQLERAGIVSSDPNTPRHQSAGSSPALRIACPVCGAGTGAYCRKNGRNEVQVIAHKRRREEEVRTR